ncbi:MAG: LysM peptidoglycan-binding domain-containing protein [Vicinamibacterales bacterium]
MRRAVALALALAVTAACAAKRPAVVATPPAPVVAAPADPPAPPPPDPVAEALTAAERAFEAGRRALDDGHLSDARLAFDQALDTLLLVPGGARADARLAAALDALVDRISAVELDALARGDGFTETASEPASIDSLLSLPPPEATPAPSVVTTVREDLAATAHDIPIPQNDRVLGYVEAFQGRLRTFLSEGLTRGAEYMPMIQAVFREEGLPLDLAYVPLVESAFKPTALSRASARGVWQFMRPTARENGLTHDWYIDERADPEKATRAAARYLKTLHRIFDGDWHLALASYNGGPGRVQRAVKRYGVRDFWRLSATRGRLPRETREYVPMILAAMIIARNPGQYGFEVPAAAPPATEVVTLRGPVDLRRIAEWANVPADDIRALNPELRRWTTPVRDSAYRIKVPAGSAAAVAEAHAATAPEDAASLQFYAVRKGESMATIARKLRVSRTDLAEANYLRANARVRPGQKLVVPRAPSPALLARREAAPTAPAAPAAASDAAPAVAIAEAAADAAPAVIVYRVRKGDTLYAIARRHGVTVDELRAWNRLRGSALSIGTRLSIHTSRAAAAQ